MLLVNQRVVLYLFYIPVVISAWYLNKRGAVGIAALGALVVVTYGIFIPEKLINQGNAMFFWMEMAIWGGILVVTAYIISTLRAMTEDVNMT